MIYDQGACCYETLGGYWLVQSAPVGYRHMIRDAENAEPENA